MMSGPRIEKFSEGWALSIWDFGRAHYFVRRAAGPAYPICGGPPRPAGYLNEPGNWKKCMRCERSKKLPNTGNRTD